MVKVKLGGSQLTQKRMKKRKDLDALIEYRTRQDRFGHDIGHSEYDSLSNTSSPAVDNYMAPNDTAYIPSKSITQNSAKYGCTVRRMIRICLPTCFLCLVAACITACIGIVWMQVQLKTDVERLKDRLVKLEAWQHGQPVTINDIRKSVEELQTGLQKVNNGENGIKKLAEKIAVLAQKSEWHETIPKQALEDLKSQVDQIKKDEDAHKNYIIKLSSALSDLVQKLSDEMPKLQLDPLVTKDIESLPKKS